MKHVNYNLFKRLLCMAMILVMLLSLVACGESSTDTNSTTQSTAPATQPTTESTAPSETTQPTESTQPEPETNELFFELTQEDVDAYYAYLTDCETLSIAGEDMDAIEAASEVLDEAYEYLFEQRSIAMIQHYTHTKDEALEKQYLDCVEICTDAYDAYIQMARRVYLSDSPAKDMLFEGWTEQDIQDLLNYDEQVAQLQQRNSEIEVEYRASNDDNVKIPLYIELVQNNNQIAQIYGYDNYYVYAYERVYERDYTPDTLIQMRQHAKFYLTSCFTTAYSNFEKSFYSGLEYIDQLGIQDFLYRAYDALGRNYVELYLNSVPEEMRDVMYRMLEVDSLFTNAFDSMEGAFTTTIGDRSYCYYGPGYASTNTVLHEAGHYFASRYTDLNAIPLDLAETHSQGNEWLFAKFLGENMSAKRYGALLDYMLYEDIAMILICLMVDEFEQFVYTTDVTNFTARDFDAIMNRVTAEYFPGVNVSETLADMNSYWRAVVVDQPVYYVSYAVSSVAAMSLFTMAQEDYDAAMAAYMKLCMEPLEDAGFLGNIQAAGLYSPFDETFYQQLKQLLEERG